VTLQSRTIFISMHPPRRADKREEAARTIVFLLPDAASFFGAADRSVGGRTQAVRP
jgi:hypothetical protein